jgi:hypothetical protein
VVLEHAAEASLDKVDPAALVPVDVELPLASLVLARRKARASVALVDVLDDDQVFGRGGRRARGAGDEDVGRDGRGQDREARIVDMLACRETKMRQRPEPGARNASIRKKGRTDQADGA